MEKNRGLYSYPIYDTLSYSVLDEIIHFNFIHRFYEILGKEKPIIFVVHSGENYLKRLREKAPYARLIYADRYTDEIALLIKELYTMEKLKVHYLNNYYCEKCDEFYKAHEVKIIEREIKRNLVKIRIAKRTYFIGEMESGEEAVGVFIGGEDLILVSFPDEKWLAPSHLRDILIEKLEVPEDKIKKVEKGTLEKINFKSHVILGDGNSRIIRKGDVEELHLKSKIPSYSLIYSFKRVEPIHVCPKCGSVLVERKIPVLFAEDEEVKIQLSSPSGSYKLPVLHCSNCGHIEYGEKIMDCPVCGGIMERKFMLRPELVAVGAYVHELHHPVDLSFVHIRRVGVQKAIEGMLRLSRGYFFNRRILLSHDLMNEPDEDEECVLLMKRRGRVNEEDLRKVRKLKSVVENIVRYVEIYGQSDEYTDVDYWALWKNEEVKRSIVQLVEKGKIEESFDRFYNYVLHDISHFYVPLKRKDPLARKLIKDILTLLYPYLPKFAASLMEKLGIDRIILSFEDYPEIESVEVLRDVITLLREYRERNNIPLREPLKKVVFVSEYAGDINDLRPYIFRVENIIALTAVREWEEMEIEIEPNIEEISAAYRAWAPKISFLLRRKNVKEVMDAMEKGGYTLGVEGFLIKITPKMVRYLKKVPEGYEELKSKYGELYVYTERDASTRRIRLVKEIVRRINSMRKDIEMDFDDLVDVNIYGNSDVIKMVKGYEDEIKQQCLARNVEYYIPEYGYVVEWPIMGYRIIIGINPLFKKWVIKAFKSIPGIDESRAELLFKLGFGSIYELMETKPEELAEISGIPLNMARKIIDYVYSTAFKSKKVKGREYCPFCGAELSQEDEFCPLCGAPIRVKMKEKRMKRGNLYLVIGDLRKMIDSVPEEILSEKKLLITKDNPEEVKKEYDLKNVQTLWISYVPFGKSIKPKEIDKLESEIIRFIEKGGKLILADCFDLLLAINSLDSLMEVLRRIKEKLKEKNAYMFFNIEEIESFELEKIMKYVDGEIR